MAGTTLMNTANARRLLTGFDAVVAYKPKIPANAIKHATISFAIISLPFVRIRSCCDLLDLPRLSAGSFKLIPKLFSVCVFRAALETF